MFKDKPVWPDVVTFSTTETVCALRKYKAYVEAHLYGHSRNSFGLKASWKKSTQILLSAYYVMASDTN